MYLEDYLQQQPIVPRIRAVEYDLPKPWPALEQTSDSYILIYVEQGGLRVTTDGKSEDFGRGSFCLIQPNTVYNLMPSGKSITPIILMDIFQTTLSEQPRLDSFVGIRIPSRLQPSMATRFKDLFVSLLQSWDTFKSAHNLEAQALATGLIHMLLSDCSNASVSSPNQTRLDWMPAYLQLHLHTPVSLEQMAQRAQLSTSRFRALFKQEFGVAPHQYLMQLRIEQAQKLLEQTARTIEEIATVCGFADIHHFSKAFKKQVSLAPNAYRKSFL
jgi:AraC-like DNA-binding protein